ncbi:hypothetical protein HYV86_04995 [Candidatus Woesearchaeota archaeon]|nr:hypothetical protein [Candidatus Woesearchaeota archaeon]
MLTKRGQQGAAGGAAVLLVVIAALIIGFVILIPPADRAELLGTPTGTGSNNSAGVAIGDRLLDVTPGRIDYLSQRVVEHPLPVVNLFTSTESRVLEERGTLLTKKGIFTNDEAQLRFALDNPSTTDRVLLGFTVRESKGPLEILLNGERVFEGELKVGNVAPVSLAKSMLTADNTLTFRSGSVGAAFWRTHKVTLDAVKVLADVTQLDAQFSRHSFLVSDTEKAALERLVLKFQPDCIYTQVGRLSVMVNGREVYNAVPDCEVAMVPIEFGSATVNAGENEVVFRAERGSYLLSHIVLESHLKEIDYPTYYFELSNEDFNAVERGDRKVHVTMFFVDVVETKKMDLLVNGHINQFESNERSYSFDISDDIEQGNNAVKLKPRRSVEVRRMVIELVKD